MSKKKNKRYIFCITSLYYRDRWWHWTPNENDIMWDMKKCSREDLILELAMKLKHDPTIFDYVTDDLDVIPNRKTKEKCIVRPGVSGYKYTYHRVICIKCICGDEFRSIDLKALKKDVEQKLAEMSKPRKVKHNYSWKYRYPWKEQYKCKHQWEIHQRRKVYVDKYYKSKYDPSWEE